MNHLQIYIIIHHISIYQWSNKRKLDTRASTKGQGVAGSGFSIATMVRSKGRNDEAELHGKTKWQSAEGAAATGLRCLQCEPQPSDKRDIAVHSVALTNCRSQRSLVVKCAIPRLSVNTKWEHKFALQVFAKEKRVCLYLDCEANSAFRRIPLLLPHNIVTVYARRKSDVTEELMQPSDSSNSKSWCESA